MTDYEELVKSLRYCGNFEDRDGCDEECPYFIDKDCPKRIMCDAADALEAEDKRIAELERILKEAQKNSGINFRLWQEEEARLQKWTMLKDEMPKPHTNVLVSGIEAINNSRVYKVMVNDNGTLRPTDYAPSIRWDYWMPFDCPNCGARMRKGEENER